MDLTDKNLIVVKNGEDCFISVNGRIAEQNKKPLIYKRRRKYVKEGTLVLNKSFELLKIENEIIFYNTNTGYWCITKKGKAI